MNIFRFCLLELLLKLLDAHFRLFLFLGLSLGYNLKLFFIFFGAALTSAFVVWYDPEVVSIHVVFRIENDILLILMPPKVIIFTNDLELFAKVLRWLTVDSF